MTTNTKKWLGHTLILITLSIISFCTINISSNNEMIRQGKEEVLSTIDGKKLPEVKVSVNYKHAHGIDIHHANQLQAESKIEPDFIVKFDNKEAGFVFVEEEQIAVVRTRTKDFTIAILKKFDGKIQIKNNVCGCEGLVNLVYFVGGAIISLVLVLLAAGFYYSAKKNQIDLSK